MKKNPDPKTAPSAAPAAPAGLPGAGYSRLHITPLDPQLLKVVVPSAVLPHAKNVSFHALQTFPDRPYGFVDLPSADAEKIKKRLNGAVLKGSKIRIEPARPINMPEPSPDALMDTKSKKSKSGKRDKKRKRDAQEVVGVELEEGRKVKRGWTVTPDEAAAKKKKEKDHEKKKAKSKDKQDKKENDKKKKKKDPESKYSEGPECLVKTTLPPNKLDLADDITGGTKKKSKKGEKREVVVHEFEKNTKFATFLKTVQPANAESAQAGAVFVEGKGWVNEDGTVVEDVKSTRPTTIPKLQVSKKQVPPASADDGDDDDTSSSSGSSSSEGESESESELLPEATQQLKIATRLARPGVDNVPSPDAADETDTARPKSASSLRSLSIKIPPATPTPTSKSAKVHPLEALYKRQKQEEATPSKPLDAAEPFTFFGGQDADEDEEMADGQDGEGSGMEAEDDNDGRPESSQGPQPPMTPFTKQDFEWRNTRSAAPTPDTAHPSRISRTWYQRGNSEEGLDDVEEDRGEDDEHIMEGQEGVTGGEDGGEGATNPNTDFQKWFWEHRGDLNRSWKKRRKTTAKEKRYRENRARADRAI